VYTRLLKTIYSPQKHKKADLALNSNQLGRIVRLASYFIFTTSEKPRNHTVEEKKTNAIMQ
jgi:hypothetical protein